MSGSRHTSCLDLFPLEIHQIEPTKKNNSLKGFGPNLCSPSVTFCLLWSVLRLLSEIVIASIAKFKSLIVFILKQLLRTVAQSRFLKPYSQNESCLPRHPSPFNLTILSLPESLTLINISLILPAQSLNTAMVKFSVLLFFKSYKSCKFENHFLQLHF